MKKKSNPSSTQRESQLPKTPINTISIKPSRSIVGEYKQGKEGGSSLNVSGRGTTFLSQGKQGEHIIAYGLIQRATIKILSDISLDAGKDSYYAMYEKRHALYKFVSAIAILGKSESLYKAIDSVLEKYNKNRGKKGNIHEQKVFAGKQEDIGIVKILQENVVSLYSAYGNHMATASQEIVNVLLTYYNKLPSVNHLPIDGFKGDKKLEKPALNALNKIRNNVEEYPIDIIVGHISDLIHYPEITDKNILELHQEQTEKILKNSKQGRLEGFMRNNRKETFVSVLGRHMHIIFAAYPELALSDESQKDLTYACVKHVIKKSTHGWPSFTDKVSVLQEGVYKEVSLLQKLAQEISYTQRSEYAELQSSPDPSPVKKRPYSVLAEKGETKTPVRFSKRLRKLSDEADNATKAR